MPSFLGIALAAGDVPFGHADWRPSPTDPVGFAGQGGDWFPGATPPLEWSDTVDGKSRNLRWKAPIPGWTDTRPVAIGRAIVGIYSPHHVVCFDADTGKVLWQDELKIMALPELGNDRQTTGPTPDPVQAAKFQGLWEPELAHYGAAGLAFDARACASPGGVVRHCQQVRGAAASILGDPAVVIAEDAVAATLDAAGGSAQATIGRAAASTIRVSRFRSLTYYPTSSREI